MVEVTENTGIMSFDKHLTWKAAWKTRVSLIYPEWITFDFCNAAYTPGK